MFHEICIYEAKINKQNEIEELMKKAADVNLVLPGIYFTAL